MKTENDNKNIKEEDYSLIEKIGIVLFPFIFYRYDTDLKKNGYITKSRSKIICVILGFLLYAIIILLSNIV
jgi:hypothetical protein